MKSQHHEFRALLEQAHQNLQSMLSQLTSGDAPEEVDVSARQSIQTRLSEFHDNPELWENETALVNRLVEAERQWTEEIRRLRETTSQELERLRARRHGVNRYVGA